MNAIEEAVAVAIEASLKRGRGPDPGPFAQYYDDPAGFFRDVLGVIPWKKLDAASKFSDQLSVVEAAARTDRVTVRSGHGVGKTRLAAGLVLWFVMTRGPGCRAFLTATKAAQAEQGIWRELRLMFIRAKVDFAVLGWTLPKLGSTGLDGPDLQQVLIITADQAEGLQGLRAAEMMVVADEASGIDDRLFVALEANLSGGGKFILIGNPTKADGYFFEANRSPAWDRHHIPSTASPNVVAGHRVIPGLVERDWCVARAEAWGIESALYKIRVLGEHVEQQEGRLFTTEMIETAEKRWTSAEGVGRITVGIDPAGDGGEGDKSAFASRRGAKIFQVHTRIGLSADGHVTEALGQVAMHGRDHDPPRFIVDVSGIPGAKVYAAFLNYLAEHQGAFELVGVRPSDHAKRRPFEVDKMRDELWFNLVDFVREGGALPPDVELEGDLGAIRFDKMNAGRAKVLGKPQIRRELGRSPDKGDAVTLAAYEPVDHSARIESEIRAAEAAPAAREEAYAQRSEDIIDPYAGQDADPYAGAPGGFRRR